MMFLLQTLIIAASSDYFLKIRSSRVLRANARLDVAKKTLIQMQIQNIMGLVKKWLLPTMIM
jgi:hypothetical protein